jgi:hypothetical protein
MTPKELTEEEEREEAELEVVVETREVSVRCWDGQIMLDSGVY